ncbi:MAG TPA: aminomethyltransferase, partial [Gammaproteobacteria bacterium]|nr:aminomethyltransferase [Gammaproteobacteria bacterium]
MPTPSITPSLLEPGLWRSDPSLERYQVKGGGIVVVRLRPGDTITIQDPQGRQNGEVIVFDKNGRPAPGALSNHSVQKPTGLGSILSDRDINTRSLTEQLSASGITLDDALAIPLFSSDSSPGEEVEFTTSDDLTCLVCAPGQSMTVDEQNPPTPLVMWVRRSDLMGETDPVLPDPLAEPRLDFRIERRTAREYVVRAGEFIQIIDVAGRECSDFLAFTESKLDQGIERCLDPTTTRTLMGAAY